MNLFFTISGYFKIIIGLLFYLLTLASYASNGLENSAQEERYRQAGHPATTPSMFNDLSYDSDASIRRRVASNRKTPKNILLRLAYDSDQAVKISLATNLSAEDEVYQILARDPMLAVRSVVARFEYVPIIALEILSKDKEVDIRLEVARNLNSTQAILTALTHDLDNTVKAIAEQALQRLRDDENRSFLK